MALRIHTTIEAIRGRYREWTPAEPKRISGIALQVAPRWTVYDRRTLEFVRLGAPQLPMCMSSVKNSTKHCFGRMDQNLQTIVYSQIKILYTRVIIDKGPSWIFLYR